MEKMLNSTAKLHISGETHMLPRVVYFQLGYINQEFFRYPCIFMPSSLCQPKESQNNFLSHYQPFNEKS